MSGQRDVMYHPHPIYDMPGFGLDALPRSYATTKEVVAAQSGNFTSAAITHGTNGFELVGAFTGTVTSCVVSILDAGNADALLASYTLTPSAEVKYFTFFDTRLQISAYPSIKFRLSSMVGTGTVALSIRPTA